MFLKLAFTAFTYAAMQRNLFIERGTFTTAHAQIERTQQFSAKMTLVCLTPDGHGSIYISNQQPF
jgi:hypothetical protein